MTLMKSARAELSGDMGSPPDQMIGDDSKSKLRPIRKFITLGVTSWQCGEEN